MPILSNNDLIDVRCWLRDNDINANVELLLHDPTTSQPNALIYFKDNKHKTAFLLKWGNRGR